jgi:hypothetical protein
LKGRLLSMKELREKDGRLELAHSPSPLIFRGRALMKFSLALLPIAAAVVLSAPSALFSQEAAQPVASELHVADPATDSPGVSTAAAGTKSVPVTKAWVDRWLELDTLSHSERYRNAFSVGDYRMFDNAQQKSLVEGKVKLDSKGRYRIGFRASSGGYFNWAFGSYTGESFLARLSDPAFALKYCTPAQYFALAQAEFADPTGSLLSQALVSNGWHFYMRELYFSATPVKPVTVEFGSFGFERGLSTEITTFDEDGYLSGERVRIHDSKHLFFDEVGFTNAFFGDIATPNLFDRGSSLTKFNYRQAFAKKQLNTRLGVSGEYSWQAAIDTLREAAVIGTKESKVIDSVRVEAYERLNSKVFPGLAESPVGPIPSLSVRGASGLAVAAQKSLGRMSGDVGFASIDSRYSVYSNGRLFEAGSFPLNGDAYGQGNRIFGHASIKIAQGVTAFGFYTHEVGSTRVLTFNQQGLSAGVTFNLKSILNSEKRVL